MPSSRFAGDARDVTREFFLEGAEPISMLTH